MDTIPKRSLSTRDEQYRILVEGISDHAIYMLDTHGIITSWNFGAERMKGYAEEEIIGRHFSIFYCDADCKAGVPDTALLTAARAGRFESDGWRLRKNGSRFWAHVIINAIRDDRGELIGFAKITRDASERRMVEEELRKSEEQFRLLLQGVTDYAIYVLDPGGHVSSWNLGAERIKGFRREEIVGQHFSRFYTPEDIAIGEPARTLRTAAETGRFEIDGWRLRKDGSRFWANVVVDAIRNDEGELTGYAKITRDITEKLKASRAHEQTREQLFQAQKMEAIGQLTGGVAHDFNNVLMAISGGLNLIRRRIPESQVTGQLIDNAQNVVERGAKLTKQLLAFARRQELLYEAIDLAELVDEAMGMIRLSLGSSVTVTTDIASGLPRIRSDQNQLGNAILNLALNARDAMPADGTVTISARMERTDPSSKVYVCLSVKDQGSGMDATTLAEATVPFFTTKGVGKGTGLGLSMVKGLMEECGGKLALVSQLGIGTEAQLWLPLARPEDQPVLLADKATEPTEFAPLRVLAVDDDGLVLMNTVQMLEDLGHQVIAAGSAIEALSILDADQRIDLVVTDHAMPHMTGSQLAEVIGKRNPKIRCMLATGYVELPPGGDRDLPRLSKPFTREQLRATVQKVMA